MTTDTLILGRQTFDGLGRQRSVQVAGRSTHYHYRAGQLPPSANTLADGKRVAFTYEPQLGNALLGSHAEGATQQRLDYHPRSACRAPPVASWAASIGALTQRACHCVTHGRSMARSTAPNGATRSMACCWVSPTAAQWSTSVSTIGSAGSVCSKSAK